MPRPLTVSREVWPKWPTTSRTPRTARSSSQPFEEPGCEHDVDDIGNGGRASPVALQLAGERYPANGLCARPNDALETGPVRLRRGPTHCVDDREHLVALAERVQGRESQTPLRPQRGHDQLPPPRRLDCAAEFDVLPGVDLGAVDLDR